MKETKLSAGIVTTILAAGLAGAGLYMYFQNAGTASFANLGKDPVVIWCLAAAIAVLVLSIVFGRPSPSWTDVLPVAAPILSIVSLLVMANSRINGIASILTFTNNAQSMADLKSALLAMILIAASALMGLLNAFLDVRKYKKLPQPEAPAESQPETTAETQPETPAESQPETTAENQPEAPATAEE